MKRKWFGLGMGISFEGLGLVKLSLRVQIIGVLLAMKAIYKP
jgi:hypothetical protein